MAYQVILKRVLDKEIVAKIAAEVAAMSGASPEQVASALSSKNISIGKDFSAEKAEELKARFAALGGEIQVVNLEATQSDDDDEEDEEEEDDGRLLSHEEYVKALNGRGDIFYTEKDKKLRVIMPVMFVLGIIGGIYLTTVSLAKIAPDFYEKHMEERTVTLKDEIDLTKDLDEEKEEEKKEDFKKEKKSLKPKKQSKNKSASARGGGDPRARVTKKGVLGIISGAVTGASVANADPLGKGGYASGIDAVLAGTGGLKAGGGGGTGRKGAAGIGFGAGYGSGFGGGSGGVDDLLGSLMGGGGSNVKLKKRGALKVRQPSGSGGASMTGGRSRASIMRVVRQNMASLKYAYNGRLREKPGMKGKITIKWAIDEFGKVLFCKVVSSTIDDPIFEQIVVKKIKRWAFGKIDKPGDVTEVAYPFVFHQ
jgi:outer membrane biosynthesis protein TonB